MTDDSLTLFHNSDIAEEINREISERDTKAEALALCESFPHAFALLPVGSPAPSQKGTWGEYPFDKVFRFWINSSHEEALRFFRKKLNEEKEAIMGQEITRAEEDSVRTMLAANVKAIKSVLPRHMTPERMMRIAWTAISRNPKLTRCTHLSLFNAVIEASMLGLEVNSPLMQAVMVPFWNSKIKQFEAVLIVEYMGKIELAYRSGMVRSFQAHPVFSEDKFSFHYGLNPELIHEPAKKADRGKLIAAYAVVNYMHGGFDFEVIEEAEAQAAKDKSASAKQDEKNNTSESAWNTEDEPSMWVKTAVHRLFKRVPKSPEYRQLARAEELNRLAESGEPQDFGYIDASLKGALVGEDGRAIGDGACGEDPEKEKGGNGKEAGDQGDGKKSEPEAGKQEAGSAPEGKKEPAGAGQKQESWDKLQGSSMDRAKALEKADEKLFKEACAQVGVFRPMTDAAAVKVLKAANEISKKK